MGAAVISQSSNHDSAGVEDKGYDDDDDDVSERAGHPSLSLVSGRRISGLSGGMETAV